MGIFKCNKCNKEYTNRYQYIGHCASHYPRKQRTIIKPRKPRTKDETKYHCLFCQRLCIGKNSYTQHIIRCKENPNQITNLANNNFDLYNKMIKSGSLVRINQYTKSIKLGHTKPKMSLEARNKISQSSKNRVYTDEYRLKMKAIMKQVVKNNPNSYNKSNINGRTKKHVFTDSFGNDVILDSGWELLVAKYLTEQNIKWITYITEELTYDWLGSTRRYFPDFYLVDYNIYIEVKGHQRDRDIAKWDIPSIKNRLIVINYSKIKKINNNEFDIFEYLH